MTSKIINTNVFISKPLWWFDEQKVILPPCHFHTLDMFLKFVSPVDVSKKTEINPVGA